MRQRLKCRMTTGRLQNALVPVLKPLKLVTTMSSGQKYPSLSAVYPQLFIILKHLQAVPPQESAAVQLCRTTIANELLQRYFPDRYSTLNAPKATVLDPRYKLLKCFDEPAVRQETYAAIRREQETIVIATADNEPEGDVTNAGNAADHQSKKARVELEPENIFDDLALLCSADDDSLVHTDELTAYLAETPLSVKADIIQYWNDNSRRYPKLATLARKYLCIPATSVPSECAFSTAGHVVNRRRANLAPETVDMLVFLNRNWDICN